MHRNAWGKRTIIEDSSERILIINPKVVNLRRGEENDLSIDKGILSKRDWEAVIEELKGMPFESIRDWRK